MRNRSIDALRGLAMVLVVLGHAMQFGPARVVDVFSNDIFAAIYAFHMPLFAFVMGYVSTGSLEKTSRSTVLKRRTLRLLVPYVSWSILVALLRAASEPNFTLESFVTSTVAVLREPQLGVWFLWFAYLASVSFVAVAGMAARWRLAALCALEIALFLIPAESLLAVSHIRWLFPFAIAGYALALRRIDLFAVPHSLAATAGGLFLLLIPLWQRDFSVYVDGSRLPGNSTSAGLVIWAFRFTLAILGIVIAAWAVSALRGARLHAWMAKIGLHALPIYGTQTILFRLTLAVPVVTTSAPLALFATTVATAGAVMALSVGLALLCERNRLAGVLLAGSPATRRGELQ